MINAKVETYSDEHIEELITNRHTGTWKIGTTKGEFRSYLEFHYYNGLKPHWFHRLMARILLGWKWEEKK